MGPMSVAAAAAATHTVIFLEKKKRVAMNNSIDFPPSCFYCGWFRAMALHFTLLYTQTHTHTTCIYYLCRQTQLVVAHRSSSQSAATWAPCKVVLTQHWDTDVEELPATCQPWDGTTHIPLTTLELSAPPQASISIQDQITESFSPPVPVFISCGSDCIYITAFLLYGCEKNKWKYSEGSTFFFPNLE